MALSESAPAKINLYLHVLGRRADGYHQLDSLVVFGDVGDVITAEPADQLTLDIQGPFRAALTTEADNLVLRAARKLRNAVHGGGAHLTLIKNLPVAAGLGGGSADAAAALRVLMRLWDREPADLFGLALDLGADVPVCLSGRPAVMRDIGEKLLPPPPLPALWLVIVNPGIGLSTPAVFKARLGPFSTPVAIDTIPSARADFISFLATCDNDLQAAAIELVPEIGRALAALAATEGCLLTRMSGSGSTCFGIFATAARAAAAATTIERAQPVWWTRASTVLGK